MKILLILPKTKGSFDVYSTSPITRILRFFYSGADIRRNMFLPPLGLLTVAACTPKDVEVQIVDEKVGDFVDFNVDVDLVGISIFAYSARRGYEIADEFRRRGRKVVLGGFHVSFRVEEALEHADAVVVGEAEPVWKDLIEDTRAGKLKRVYKADEFLPLDCTPFPRFDLINSDRYLLKNVTQVTRGCPFHCDFCSVKAFFGKTFRVKPVEQVLSELGPLKECEWVCFVDDNIVGNQAYAMELFKALIPLRIKWISQGSLTIANNKDLLALAAESGCFCLLIGIETVQPDNIKYTGGKLVPSRIEEQIGKIHEVGIGINGSFMHGLDGDTPETFEQTADFCIQNYIELPSFNVFNPIPGTPLYEKMKAEGRLRINGYHEHEEIIFRRKLFYTPKGMSEREFYEGFDKMCRKVFSYTNILRRNLKYRIGFKEYIYFNFLWRQCDLQLGRRSFTNL
jgi:radical SAM superfamily enzyme YgiQ (UPF0313 family)